MLTARAALTELSRPGEGAISGPELAGLGQVVLTATIVLTNLLGVLAVLALALLVVPLPQLARSNHIRLLNVLVATGYTLLALPAGAWIGTRRMNRLRTWLIEDRPAGAVEQRLVLYAPLRLFTIQVSLWLVAALLFTGINLPASTRLAERVLVTVALSGLVTASCAYLLTEILLRPVAARALGTGLTRPAAVPGVATRAILAWAVGSGIAVLGLIAVGILGLTGDPSATRHRLGVAVVVLGGVGLAVGLLAVTAAARVTADPIASVRRALHRVRQGDFSARVPVYDGSQVGQLQAGFNEMVAGLAERERIRSTFGAYVDPDVAEHILEEGVDLAGERVEVTIMFLDVRGFTRIAAGCSPEAALEQLNRLFERAVEVVHAHSGRVDKFVGDGLMAVFGAPRRQPRHADAAVQAASEIARVVEDEDLLAVGIGLNSGEVVAGNVGGSGRLEFTVIGDAVNLAARVQAATRKTGDVTLLTERTRELLGEQAPPLREREAIELRGVEAPVTLYAVGAEAAQRPAL